MGEPVKVYCQDGMAGWVKEIIIDPRTGQPTFLVIERLNYGLPEVTVSIQSVALITDDQVLLNTSLEALDILSRYQLTKSLQHDEEIAA